MRTIALLFFTAVLALAAILWVTSARAADVTLAWDYAGTEHTGFRLRYKVIGGAYQTAADAIPKSARQVTHKNAPLGTLLYKLTAYNAGSESAPAYLWAVIDEEPAGPPAAPTATTVITISVSAP